MVFILFSNVLFSLSSVPQSFSKLEKILTLMIMKTKTLGIDKIQFKTYLNILVSNVFLALKIMN
jgi:hypothetical protein